MSTSIRVRIDKELTNRVGKWFTVRQIQDKLKVNPSTLKPLIMKYAREKVLVRRRIKGTARGVEFSPAANNVTKFQKVLVNNMPYRFANTTAATTTSTTRTKKSAGARRGKRSR